MFDEKETCFIEYRKKYKTTTMGTWKFYHPFNEVENENGEIYERWQIFTLPNSQTVSI